MQKLVSLAIAYALGIGLGSNWGSVGALVGLGFVSVLVGVRWRWLGLHLLSLTAGAIAVSAQLERSAVPPAMPRGEEIYQGTVVFPVEDTALLRRVVVEVQSIVSNGRVRGAQARVLVTESPGRVAPLPGDEIRFRGTLRVPVGYGDEGAFDTRRNAAIDDLDYFASAEPPGLVRVDAPASATVWRLAAEANVEGARRVGHATTGEARGLLSALVLGRRGALTARVEDSFRKAGVSHVLSVSGLHLAAVALISYALARWLWLRSSWLALRISAERVGAAVALPIAVAYTLLTGAQLATVRALVCTVVFLVGAATGRRVHASSSLALAALLILAHSPLALFDASFQLSFVATASLSTLAVRWASLARSAPRWIAWLVRLACASLAATIATAPFTALHFGVVQPAGVLTNLIVVPLAELVVLPLGLLGLLASPIPGGGLVLQLAGLSASLLAALVEKLAAVSPVFEVSPPNAVEWVLLIVALAALTWVRPAWRAVWLFALFFALVLASYTLTIFVLPKFRGDLMVTFLDVGQGDAAVIELPGGDTWLIDSGGRLFGERGPDPGEQAVWPFLRARRIRRLDRVIISHPHPDHYAGLVAVARHLPIGELWAGSEEGAPEWHRLLSELRALGTRVTPPARSISKRGVTLEVMAPLVNGVLAVDPERGINDNSLVVRIRFGTRSLLFPGDLEAEGESVLQSQRMDVVKAPHHGSKTSSSADFVARTSPPFLVVSCGRHNQFGFPHAEVLDRWLMQGAEILRTDTRGAVRVVVSSSGSMTISTFWPRNPDAASPIPGP